jgi:hypothetical protein
VKDPQKELQELKDSLARESGDEDDSAEDNSNDNDNDRVPKRHRSTDVDDAAESDGDL